MVRGLRNRLSSRPPIWLGGPLALAVLGFGFGLQQVQLRSAAVDDPMLDALLADSGGPPLSQLQTARATQRTRTEPGFPMRVSLTEPAPGPALPLEIRIALLSAGAFPQITSTGPWQLRSATGAVLQQGRAGEPVETALARQSGEAWLITSPQGSLQVNGKGYSGRLRLIPADGGVQVINHLSLESYIASVVGSEMPSSWPMDALMAQAVAARSYALAHMARPASRHWHLGDTTRWQAYTGQERINGRTLQAAKRTTGLILSYQGAIVESLYAANRQISLEAHGNLGASMSQQGARSLAEEGHRYNAILGRYYPGASLARLRAGAG